MRHPKLTAAIVILGASACGHAAAQTCPAGTTRVTALNTLVSGKTMCATSPPDRWQEYHEPGGALKDYKRGPSDPVDPTTTVGTWTARNGVDAVLAHTYGAQRYMWLVCQAGPNNYTMVQPGVRLAVTNVTLLPGQVPCP